MEKAETSSPTIYHLLPTTSATSTAQHYLHTAALITAQQLVLSKSLQLFSFKSSTAQQRTTSQQLLSLKTVHIKEAEVSTK